jgi:hypothetical protein
LSLVSEVKTPGVKNMTVEVHVGFPDLDGYSMHTSLETCQPGAIVLWFNKVSDDAQLLTDLHVYLYEARLELVNIEINPHFPEVSYVSLQKQSNQNLKKWDLKIFFAKGDMWLSFSEASYVKRTRKLGSTSIGSRKQDQS